MQRLDTLTDHEIRSMDRYMARKILNVLEAFIKIHQPQSNIFEVSETYELKIAQKYLMSPFFDKKIRGMADFKEIFNKVENKRRNTDENEIRMKGIQVCRYLNL